MSRRAAIVLDCCLLFLIAAGLIRPLFKAKYLNKWASIESTFISDARFLKEHWPRPQWQPLWYAGTRFDYIYPPALRYGSAAVSKALGVIPAKGYHIYIAFFYCAGIAGVYLLVRAGLKSRVAAWLTALATALMSPSFLLLKPVRDDSWHWLPLRLGVLSKYGEGPHMTALALIPFALAFTWLALEKRRPWAVAMAALFSASVVSNNFYGATALAIFYPLLVWSFWITRQDRRILLPAFAIPALAYGLTAFWLTFSYLHITIENMQYVSERGTTWSLWVALAVAILFLLATDKLARGRQDRTWAVFVAGTVVFYTLNVLGNYLFNFRVIGEPARLVPELDLVYLMAGATVLHWLWMRRGTPGKVAAVAVWVCAFATTAGYVRWAWHMFETYPDYQNRVEFRIPDWMAKNMPDARAYPSGSVRFWYNAWHDLPQLGGGSEQGLINRVIVPAQWEITMGRDGPLSVLWMQAMGVDAVYVSDKQSEEIYKDIVYPQKFVGILPVIFDDQKGNMIYRVPRRYTARARVVETARHDRTKVPRGGTDADSVRAYVDVVEKGPDSPVTLTREGTDAMRLRATLAAGESIVVQESYDPAWQAWSGGRRLSVRKDAMGFMTIDAPPGGHEIALGFVTPLENQVGRIVTLLTLAVLTALLASGRRGRKRA